MKYIINYDTFILGVARKKGEEIEFAQGTDELFIKRLIDMNTISQAPQTKTETSKKQK